MSAVKYSSFFLVSYFNFKIELFFVSDVRRSAPNPLCQYEQQESRFFIFQIKTILYEMVKWNPKKAVRIQAVSVLFFMQNFNSKIEILILWCFITFLIYISAIELVQNVIILKLLVAKCPKTKNLVFQLT